MFILQVKVNEEVDSHNTGVIINLYSILIAPSAEITKRNLLFYWGWDFSRWWAGEIILVGLGF